jgi:hypothetical protein
MRSDMGRVVIERPRTGSSNKSPKILHFPGRIDEEGDYDGLTRLPSSRYRIYGFAPKILEKSFTDLLGPLRRYLQANLGRPWNKIYGEAKEVLKSGGWGVRHVFETHFLGEVARDVYRDQNGILVSRRFSYGRMPFPVTGFYVHPKTGLLCHAPRKPWKRRPERRDTDRIALPDGRYYVLVNGLWFIARYQEFAGPRHGAPRRWPNVEDSGGKLWICQIEKSCNRKDLREIRRVLAERA